MTESQYRARHHCDWCHGETGADVYTLFIAERIQILVGTCCARLAALALGRSDKPKIARRANEVMTMLEAQR